MAFIAAHLNAGVILGGDSVAIGIIVSLYTHTNSYITLSYPQDYE